MELTVTPSDVPGDGETPVRVSAKLLRGGGPLQDTAVVRFVATDGRWEAALDGTPDSADSTASEGEAVANLIPPKKGRGTITVTTTANVDGTALSQTKTVKLKPAGQLANRLTFTCPQTNLGGFVTGRTEPIRVICTAKAYKDNAEIPKASIEAYAEAGRLEWLKDDTGALKLVYTIDPTATPPKDVDPLGPDGKPRPLCPNVCGTDPAQCDAEPCWVESGTGITHNPRDGVATLMVAVPAVPGFADAASSNGEPFVDADDDKVRSATETYIDVNGNGKYDSADDLQGKQQDPRMLWRAVRIVWSGAVYNPTTATERNSRLKGAPTTGLAFKASLRLHDKNYNKIAAVGAAGQDLVTFSNDSCTASGVISGLTATLKLSQDGAGILFDENNDLSAPGLPSTWRRGTEYVDAVSGSIDVDSKPNHPECVISASIDRTFGPTVTGGFDSGGTLSTESVEGTISW